MKLPPDNASGQSLVDYLEKTVWPAFVQERDRLEVLGCWARGKQPEPLLLRNTEKRALLALSRSPWMRLMVSTFAQQLIVNGYRNSGSNDNAKAWDTWLRNDMQKQQLALNRSAITYGYTYLRVTEAKDKASGQGMASMRGVSPLKCYALYEDEYEDEWPRYVLEKQPDETWRWWTETDYTPLAFNNGKWTAKEPVAHKYGLVPFVRYCNEIDLEGNCWGEVEPVIELAAKLDKTAFDRLLVQHYNSFKVRYATGLEQPDSSEEVDGLKQRLSNEDILISSADNAKFGTLDETSMKDFIEAYKADLLAFLAACQLPMHTAGQIVNVAADALAAANRPAVQKLHEKQVMLASGHNQALRLVNKIEGRAEESVDFDMTVFWEDPDIKSLAQFADAWGKLIESAGVPKWAVWAKIPGVTQAEVDGWKEDYMSNEPVIKYLRELSEEPEPVIGGPNSASNRPKARNDTGEPKPGK